MLQLTAFSAIPAIALENSRSLRTAAVARLAKRRYHSVELASLLRGLTRTASTHEGQSMKVDEATVRHVARLARIKVTPEQAKALEGELSAILDWVEQLGEVDTANVEPMTRVEAMALPKREDKVTDGDIPDLVVKNAPFTEDNFFLVPKVVE
jgi:aspartyl-tRNA(Asn)/glutamyl-tRNA(Gln) amidotransferase subunit C